jgi:VanZ family protein
VTADNSRTGRDRLQALMRIIFWATMAAILFLAWTPAPPVIGASDKSQHMAAFAVLTFLFSFAYPRGGWKSALLWMAFLGALIEIVQLIPFLHRDCDINDWIADMIAVTGALVVVAALRRIVRAA